MLRCSGKQPVYSYITNNAAFKIKPAFKDPKIPKISLKISYKSVIFYHNFLFRNVLSLPGSDKEFSLDGQKSSWLLVFENKQYVT